MTTPILFALLRHDEDGVMLLEGTPFTGVALEYWPNGALASQLPFSSGLLHGVVKGWHSNGQQSEVVDYLNGNARGWNRKWHENGVLRLEQLIGERGTLLRSAEWREDGSLIKSYP